MSEQHEQHETVTLENGKTYKVVKETSFIPYAFIGVFLLGIISALLGAQKVITVPNYTIISAVVFVVLLAILFFLAYREDKKVRKCPSCGKSVRPVPPKTKRDTRKYACDECGIAIDTGR